MGSDESSANRDVASGDAHANAKLVHGVSALGPVWRQATVTSPQGGLYRWCGRTELASAPHLANLLRELTKFYRAFNSDILSLATSIQPLCAACKKHVEDNIHAEAETYYETFLQRMIQCWGF